MQVIERISEGKTNREIAEELHISAKTAEAHRANLYRKLNLHCVADAVRWFTALPAADLEVR